MKVLIACEESQRICTEMRKLGHEAYSCDIKFPSGGKFEWHIRGDVIPYIDGDCSFITMDGITHTINGEWDLIIAHPPCTYLSNAGARHLYKGGQLNQERYELGLLAKEFFLKLLNAKCKRVCVENPMPSTVFEMPEHSQTIQPYEHGDPYTKKTLLWTRGLEKLEPTNIVEVKETTIRSEKNWFNQGGRGRTANRSITFIGIARAIAEQWAGNIAEG